MVTIGKNIIGSPVAAGHMYRAEALLTDMMVSMRMIQRKV